jgi:hypothetical protein
MNEMHAEVHRFVVVEGTRDFRGKPRTPLFDPADELFARFRAKLEHHVYCASLRRMANASTADWTVEGMSRLAPVSIPSTRRWPRATVLTRRAFPPRQVLDTALLRDNDVAVLLDSDEVPTAGTLALLRRCSWGAGGAFRLRGFFLAFDLFRPKEGTQASFCTGASARQHPCRHRQGRRRGHGTRRQPGRGVLPSEGLELAKFGGPDFFARRLTSNVRISLFTQHLHRPLLTSPLLLLPPIP